MYCQVYIFTILAALFLSYTDSADWSYTGHTGPTHWHRLFPKACSGSSQSPIDILTKDSVYNPNLRDFAIWFDPPRPESRFHVINNGHTVQVNTKGQFFLANGGLPSVYTTVQFHFHWGSHNRHGSEHLVDGQASPIELHIVSYNGEKFGSIVESVMEPMGLAVLGVLYEVTETDNPILKPITDALHYIRNPDKDTEVELPAESLRRFLPKDTSRYYRYNGSLTTPGCFESVIWTVFDEKQTISRRQLQIFREVLQPKKHHGHHGGKHKRSSRDHRKERNAEAVLEELGVEGDPYEETKLKMEMEKMKAAESNDHHSTTNTQTSESELPKPELYKTSDKQTGDEPYDVQPAQSEEETATEANLQVEVVQERLVDNYRPVQPLNQREVYRSFAFQRNPNNLGLVKEVGSGASSTSPHSTMLTAVFLCAVFQLVIKLYR